MQVLCIVLGIMGLAISATVYYQKLSSGGEFERNTKNALEDMAVPDAATLQVINNEINQREKSVKVKA